MKNNNFSLNVLTNFNLKLLKKTNFKILSLLAILIKNYNQTAAENCRFCNIYKNFFHFIKPLLFAALNYEQQKYQIALI